MIRLALQKHKCYNIGFCIRKIPRDLARVAVLTLSQLRQREVEMQAQYEGW